MNTVTFQDFKQGGSKILPKQNDEPLQLIVNSKLEGIVLNPDYYYSIMDMVEDIEDIKAVIDSKKYDILKEEEFWQKAEKVRKDYENIRNKVQ